MHSFFSACTSINAGLIVLLFACGFYSHSQTSDTIKILDIAIPDFKIATINDSTLFSRKDLPKEGLLLIKYFSPDCGHCQEEAKLFLSKKKKIKNIHTLWISGSWASLEEVKVFAKTYKLHKINPIAIGKEPGSTLLDYYKITGIPFAALFKDSKLIKTWRGEVDFEELIALNNGKIE
ncbi:MAG: hypothetical protein AAGH46_05580 [Bacteroidota bacterium]